MDRFTEGLFDIFVYLDVLHVVGAWFGAVEGGGDFPAGSVPDIRVNDSLMHFGFHSNLIDFWGAFQVG